MLLCCAFRGNNKQQTKNPPSRKATAGKASPNDYAPFRLQGKQQTKNSKSLSEQIKHAIVR